VSETLADNPLLATTGYPPFDRIRPDHVAPAVEALLADTEKRLLDLEANLEPTWEGLLVPLEEMDAPYEYAWGPIGHLLGVQNTPELRDAYQAMLPKLVEMGLRVKQSEPIHAGLEQIRTSDLWKTLSPAQQRAIELRLRDALHAGISLKGEAKDRFNEIEAELSQLSNDFSNHVLDATKAFSLKITDVKDTEGWPTTLKQLAAQAYNQENKSEEANPESGPWLITLDIPSFGPFLQHSRNRQQREQVYRARASRASDGEFDNTALIAQTLKLRQEQAELLGFKTYAEVSLDSKMAPNVDAVIEMLTEISTASRPHAKQDHADLTELAKSRGQAEPLAHWDIGFWAERMREERYNYTDEEVRPYFPMPRVLQGLFDLTTRLFGVEIEAADGDSPVWHNDVRFYHITRDGERIASFYLDPYSRPEEKRGGAWMDNCLLRRVIDGKVRVPVVYLCCNGSPPVGEKPSLMSFREVETLFHEFGHGLQGMLTTVDISEVAGVSGVEWDAVEIASQFMENWCYHKPTLVGMTEHFETGEPLPDDLFDKIVAARTYRAGSNFMRQELFAMTDLRLHNGFDPTGDKTAQDVYEEGVREFSLLPPLPEDRMLNGFTHIFAGGYAAGYYSYLWSEVLSADAFAAFEEVGLDDANAVAKLGAHYRDTILALGGSRHPLEVYEMFRGRAASTAALLRHNGLA